jgi:hypothetical protein
MSSPHRDSRAGSRSQAPASASQPPATQQFSTIYPNPDDTGSSPYAPPAQTPGRWAPVLGRAPGVMGAVAVAMLIAAAVMAAFLAFGSRNGSPPETASARPPAGSTTMPSLSRLVDGADGLGFVGHPARCDPGNPPAAVVRTAQSLAVICQAGPSSFYYRGERIRDGANIELANAVRTSGGFDVTNPANGVRYEVRPQQLTILSNGHVDSAEPVLQYATAGQ